MDVLPAATVTQSIEADAEPDALVDLLADPRRIPEWAPVFADEITGNAEQGWQFVKAGQTFGFRVAVSRSSRCVDYLREVAPGREAGACLRVLPRPFGNGSVVIMTLPVAPGSAPDSVTATLGDELAALARLADGR